MVGVVAENGFQISFIKIIKKSVASRLASFVLWNLTSLELRVLLIELPALRHVRQVSV